MMQNLTILFFIFTSLLINSAGAQVEKSFTVIHCDPDDPTPTDNWPEKNISTIGWNKLRQMVSYATYRDVKVTIELTMPWVTFILDDPNKIDSLRKWQVLGHEIGAHHHIHSHAYWDGFSNISGQATNINGAFAIDSSEVFYNQLRVLCDTFSLTTAGVGPEGSEDSVAIEWSPGLIYRTYGKSKLPPPDGGRFTDEAFSTPQAESIYDPIKNKNYSVCSISYCFLESPDSVDLIISKAKNNPHSIVGGVIHPFNYNSSVIAYQKWIDSVAYLFPNQCKTVRQIMQESACQITYRNEENLHLGSKVFNTYPNPTENTFHIKFSNNMYQKVDGYIYDIHGKLIKVFFSDSCPSGDFVLFSSLYGFPAGTYLIQVHFQKSDHTINQKIVKY